MHSSKLISNKIKDPEVFISKKPASTLRKKLSAIDPSPPLDIEESYLQFSIKNKRQILQKKGKQSRNEDISTKRDVFMTPNNKIYNLKNSKHIDMNESAYLNQKVQHEKAPKTGNNFRNNQLQPRPRSSNADKYQKSIEIYSKTTEHTKQQVRPGSSKSSRLFKKKSTLVNDDMKNQNDEDDSFIKVTNREKDLNNSSTVRERQRIGTSMSKKSRGIDKFQSKLDPQFFNLFAP